MAKRPAAKSDAPRPVTAAYLRNAAMHYLSQRSASAQMVRQVLSRRAKKRAGVKRLEPEMQQLIDAAVAALVALGLIDDARFAEVRATTLAGRGLSRRRIVAGLAAKGISRETVAATAAAEVDELAQARRYVERRRLGKFRRGGVTEASRARDLAALARAGFSYGIAAKALAVAEDDGEA